eukprot:SAG22_NODE_788_length_7234_cov_18.112123_2_plen_629_part_00
MTMRVGGSSALAACVLLLVAAAPAAVVAQSGSSDGFSDEDTPAPPPPPPADEDTPPPPPPPPPPTATGVLPAVAAEVKWTETFVESTHNTPAFKASVAAWLAGVCGVPVSSISITGVVAGSIVVRFQLSSGLGGGRTSVDALSALETALTTGAAPPLEHGGATFSTPALTVTSAPSVLCDGEPNCGVGIVGSSYNIAWNDVTRLATQNLDYQPTPATDAVSSCTCDLTELHCDVTLAGGCACDLDCSAAEVARFTAQLPEGAVSNKVEYCDSAADGVLALDTANLDQMGRSTMGDVRLFEEFVDSQLCVVKENDPMIGVYFTDPGPLDSISSSYALDAAHKQNVRMDTGTFVSTFSQYTFSQPGLATVVRSATYSYGESVAMYPAETSDCIAPPQQYASLPAADGSGACSDMSYQAFGVNAGPSFCTVGAPAGASLEAACGAGTFSMSAYIGVSNMTAGTTKKPCLAATPGEATVMLLKAVITAFPCVSLPFLAVPLLSQPTVATSRRRRRAGRVGGPRPLHDGGRAAAQLGGRRHHAAGDRLRRRGLPERAGACVLCGSCRPPVVPCHCRAIEILRYWLLTAADQTLGAAAAAAAAALCASSFFLPSGRGVLHGLARPGRDHHLRGG